MNKVSTLRDDIDGPVLVPGDEDFDAARTGFQLLDQHRPDVVVRARRAGDVRAAVRFAADRRLPLAVQATGHGRAAALADGVLPYPDQPMFPEPLRGRHVVRLQLCWAGPPEAGQRLVAPLRRLGTCLQDTLRELPYRESGSVFAEPDRPHPYRSSVVLLPDLDEDGLDTLRRAAGTAPLMCVVGIRHLGGAMARPPRQPNAVGHRDAGYLVSVLSPVDGDQLAQVAATHQTLLGSWPSRSLGRSLNFSFGPLTADQVRDGFDPAASQRLADLRATLDPGRLLHPNHPVPVP